MVRRALLDHIEHVGIEDRRRTYTR
jgi:hypothetical protein